MAERFRFYAFKLAALTTIIFILQILVPKTTDLLVLNPLAYPQIWRFLTAIFLHGSLAHLVYNMFALILFGSILERLVGARRFLLIYLLSGIFSNIISLNFYSSSLGASGAIFGILGALIIIKPFMVIWAGSPAGIPLPMFLAGIVWAAGDLLGAYAFISGNPIDNTGNIAHLSGMLLGLIFGALYRERKHLKRKNAPLKIPENIVSSWENTYLRR